MTRSLVAKGKSAEYAGRELLLPTQSNSPLNNEILAGRANDLRDVGLRVLRILMDKEPYELKAPEQAILIAEELTPSFTATMDTTRIKGFCTTTGGANLPCSNPGQVP